MEIIQNISPNITLQKVYRLLGCQSGCRLSRKLTAQITRGICNTNDILNPKIIFVEKEIQKMTHNSLTLNENIMLKSKCLVQAFHGCEKVVVFLITVGIKLDKEIKILMNHGRMTEAYIWDIIGSVAVEEVVQDFQNMIDESLKKHGKKTTIRFSPGYCDWKLEEQKKIFQILPHEVIEVALNPSYLMSPRKSISGTFGIGDQKDINPLQNNPCHICTMQTCSARRANQSIQMEV